MHARIALASLVVALASSTGCGASGPGRITRRVGGEVRTGVFVSPYAYERFLRGELAELRGELAEAAREYERARAGPEDDVLLVARLADVRDRLGRERDALALLREGEALDPRSELLALTRGRIHERHGRLDDAIEAYSQAAASAPGSEEGPLALSALLRARGEREEADAVLARYLERGRGAGAARARLRLAIESGQPQAADEAVRALLEVAPARADEVRAAAVAALEGDRPELALRLLASAPEREEDRPLRLRAALRAGDRARAEGVLATWLPESPAGLLDVARGYLELGRPGRAAELARVASSANAGTTARLLLGRALRGEGRVDESAAVLASIERGSAAWPESVVELARTLRAAGRPALAAEVLERTGSDEVEVVLGLAEARGEAGDDVGALAALHGDDPQVRAARAERLEAMGRLEEAWAILAGLPLEHRAVTERARAEAALRDGERDRALRILAAWVEASPEDVLARARYAELLAAAGQQEEARRVASRALPLAVWPSVRARLARISERR